MDVFSQLLYSSLNAIDPTLYVTSTDRARMNGLDTPRREQRTILVGDGLAKDWNRRLLDRSDSVLVVVNVCDAPLSTDDYLALRDMMLGIRREIVFLRDADDDVEEGAYERMLEEWRLVL